MRLKILNRKAGGLRILPVLLLAAVALLFFPSSGYPLCQQPGLVSAVPILAPSRIQSSETGTVGIRWFGHAMFEITSPLGTKIVADPTAHLSPGTVKLDAHLVTLSHDHAAHANLSLLKGSPPVIRGLEESAATAKRRVRDVTLYTVPTFHDNVQGASRGPNTIFVFSLGEICVAHLGDLGHELTAEQLRRLGKVDVILIPIGGQFTMDPATARRVVQQIRPRLVVPMHYWESAEVEAFVAGHPRVRRLSSDRILARKSELPAETEIVVLRNAYPLGRRWGGGNN